MNKQWLSQLADAVETKYGKDARERIFGDIESMVNKHECLSDWFGKFTNSLDELNDKDFLQKMMANFCPCGGDYEKIGKAYRYIYDKSNSLAEFVDAQRQWHLDEYGDADVMELRGNVLYMTKPLGDSTDIGGCGKGCHCWLAKHTDTVVSDIFCHCCTIGHTGRPFQVAFGDDIKMELVESIVCGGNKCVMTILLPEKEKVNIDDLTLCKHGFNIYCEMLAAPTGFEVVRERNYSYITRETLRPTMVIFNVTVKKNHHEFASNLTHLIKSEKVGNHYELVKDDILFEALKNSGFSISQEDSMLIMDIADYGVDLSQDSKINISVVRTLEELKHWTAINRGYFGDLYTDEEWEEIHDQNNVTMYLASSASVPAASMLTITDGSACIELLHTLPDYRKKGLASVMIKRALSDLSAQGVSKVTVQTGAVDLFAKIGFSVVCDKYVARLASP